VKTLCVVSSGKRRIWDKCPNAGAQKARDIYVGAFSRKCQEYAQKFYPSSWYILSAKYGFCSPDDLIPGSYDVCFYDETTNPLNTLQLVQQACELHLDAFEQLVALGGQRYVRMIAHIFPDKEIVNPLAGARGIGYMIKRINRALSEAKNSELDLTSACL
jgi:hypothetical protein